MPARPGRHRLIFGFCTSARTFAPRFFQRMPRGIPPCASLEFSATCLLRGLSPPSLVSCWAHIKKAVRINTNGRFKLMRGKGVEPIRPFGHTVLSRARLPVPPPAQKTFSGNKYGWGRIRTFVGRSPTVLQTVTFDRSVTQPSFKEHKLPKIDYSKIIPAGRNRAPFRTEER